MKASNKTEKLQHLLHEKDIKTIHECLVAAVDGPFFPDWEFHPLFGVDRNELAEVLSAWPDIDLMNETTCVAIHNSMGNLVGYPHGMDAKLHDQVSMSCNEILQVMERFDAVSVISESS